MKRIKSKDEKNKEQRQKEERKYNNIKLLNFSSLLLTPFIFALSTADKIKSQ
jgi:hypothetical protein